MRFMTRKNLAQRALSLFAMLALIAGSTLPAAAQRRRTRPRVRTITRTIVRTPAPAPLRYFTVRADETIRARMDNELSSRTARIGDRFTATVTEPVYGESGVEVIPVGSKVWGRVSSVTRAGRRTPGRISVAFNALELPNRARYTINGSLASLQTDQVNADSESTVRGRSNTKRDAVFIGGGAATGALIGAIAGGGKGAGIGAIIGGALGTGARVYEKEQEADVKSGTEFGVILNQSVRLPEYRTR
jgi:Bacterial conjugation TrbI-like protein